MLEANRLLEDEVGIDIVSTYLGAHALPPGVDRDAYVDEVIDTIPEVAGRGLASFCDVYCDDGYFTLAESRRILEAGLAHGLRPKLHLDAYSHTGAARAGGRARLDHGRPPQPHDGPRARCAGSGGRDRRGHAAARFRRPEPRAGTRPHAARLGRADRARDRHLPRLLHRQHAGGDPARVPHRRPLGGPGDPRVHASTPRRPSAAPTASARSSRESRPTC